MTHTQTPAQMDAYNSQANFDDLDALIDQNGSFSTCIIRAFFLADSGNRARLVTTFPWLNVKGS